MSTNKTGFLLLQREFLKNKSLLASEKLILQFFHNLRIKGKNFFGSVEYLADTLGLEQIVVETDLSRLNNDGLIWRADGAYRITVSLEEIENFYRNKDAQNQLSDAFDKLAEKLGGAK